MKGSLECPLHIIELTQLRFLALELGDSQQPALGEAQLLSQSALPPVLCLFCACGWVLGAPWFCWEAGVILWDVFWECQTSLCLGVLWCSHGVQVSWKLLSPCVSSSAVVSAVPAVPACPLGEPGQIPGSCSSAGLGPSRGDAARAAPRTSNTAPGAFSEETVSPVCLLIIFKCRPDLNLQHGGRKREEKYLPTAFKVSLTAVN